MISDRLGSLGGPPMGPGFHMGPSHGLLGSVAAIDGISQSYIPVIINSKKCYNPIPLPSC